MSGEMDMDEPEATTNTVWKSVLTAYMAKEQCLRRFHGMRDLFGATYP